MDERGPGGAARDQAVTREYDAWRQDLQARGLFILGNALQGAEVATTVRVRDGQTLLGDAPVTKTTGFIAGIDVMPGSCRSNSSVDLA